MVAGLTGTQAPQGDCGQPGGGRAKVSSQRWRGRDTPAACPGIPRVPSTGLEPFSSTPLAACVSASSLRISFNDAPAPSVLWEEAERSFGGGKNTWKLAPVPVSLPGAWGAGGWASQSQPDLSQSCAWLWGCPVFWGVRSGLAGAEG